MSSRLVKKILIESDFTFNSWKRKNVSYRGIADINKPLDTPNYESGGSGDVLGKGLYSVPASNKIMAKKYGQLHILVNAIPKHPKVFNTLNDWEIWMQRYLVYNKYSDRIDFDKETSIEAEMQKLGYDGVVIKGREMVNYTPQNVKYFESDRQLVQYYDDFVNAR